jgi:uncharacterized protein (DUF2062 family)
MKLSFLVRARDLVWPRIGWMRSALYFRHRVSRIPGSAYSIAAGLASGASMSFTPFIGLHFVLSALLAWLVRGNILASALGTVVGNPWTFPLIWWSIYHIGAWVLGTGAVAELPDHLTMRYIFDRPFDILIPMAVGGAIAACVVWVVVHVPAWYLIDRYQMARRSRLTARRLARNAGTGAGEGFGG